MRTDTQKHRGGNKKNKYYVDDYLERVDSVGEVVQFSTDVTTVVKRVSLFVTGGQTNGKFWIK